MIQSIYFVGWFVSSLDDDRDDATYSTKSHFLFQGLHHVVLSINLTCHSMNRSVCRSGYSSVLAACFSLISSERALGCCAAVAVVVVVRLGLGSRVMDGVLVSLPGEM